MPHYNQIVQGGAQESTAFCGPSDEGQGSHCYCNCVDTTGPIHVGHSYSSGQQQHGTGMTPVVELSCVMGSGNTYNDGSTDECAAPCDSWCNTYEHTPSPQPRPARPRQSYTPGRGRGYNRGGRVNTNRSRFSGRTQNNPKGKPRK